MIKNVHLRILLFFAISFMTIILAPSFASAYNYKVGADSVLDKIVSKNISESFSLFKRSLSLNDLRNSRDFLPLDNSNTSCTVPMPNSIIQGTSEASPTLTCYEFLAGKGNTWSSVMKNNLKNSSSAEEYAQYLESIGYRRENDGVVKKCVQMLVRNVDTFESNEWFQSDNKMCGYVDSVDDVVLAIEMTDRPNNPKYYFQMDTVGNEYDTWFQDWSGDYLITGIRLDPNGSTTWSSFVSQWRTKVQDREANVDSNGLRTHLQFVENVGSDDPDVNNDITFNSTYKIGSLGDILNSILGKSTPSTLTTAEVYNIYNQYLNTTLVKVACGGDASDYENDTAFTWYPVQVKKDGAIDRTCYVREVSQVKYTGGKKLRSTSSHFYFTQRNMSLKDIVDQINSFDLDSIIDEIDEIDNPSSFSQGSDSDNTSVDCLTSGAAENLGWIICPILSFASEVSQDMYTNFVEPALKVEPKLFQERDGKDNDAYDAWLVFQGFANILFVIFFLFVIFSQLTGVGIDNYGIKKIMPKLIVTAILINLSYLICLICIDLSNIIGNGITGLFSGLSENLGMSADIASGDGGSVVVSIGSTMLTGVALFGAGYLAYVTAAMWILPLLVAAIGLLVSVIFLFILLAGREAALVVLTIISPLAFACYMLPNTKNLFSKYIKVGEVLLLLYPICGLMVAGGGYVSKLLLSVGAAEEGFFSAFAAMMISIIPIFFIPKVVKSSFNALGRLGASISGFGDRMRGRATGGIRGSGAYKAGQERLREGQTRWRAGIGSDGKPLDISNMTFRQRLARGAFTRRGVARNRAQYNKDQSARNTEALLLDPNYMENMEAHREASLSNEREKMYTEVFDREPDRNRIETELNAALRGSDPERASAALNALINKGGVSEAFNALRSITNWNAMDSNVRTRVVQAMGNSGIDAMKAYATYRNTGGLASFDNWSRGTVSAGDSSASTKNKTYAQYLRQQKEHAIDNYGKDEMQFVRSLSGDLHTQMGADYGRMVGSAMINSKDARAQTEVDDMIYDDISSGSLNAKDLGRSANELSTIRQDAIQKVMQGYRASGRGFAGIRSDLGTQINMIQTTPQLRGKLNNVAKKIFGIT